MPQVPGQDDAPGQTPDSISLDAFAGLRNCVLPERMGPRELARARNVDIDDAGQLRRRRGQRQVLAGNWRSLYSCRWNNNDIILGVNGAMLTRIWPDYSTTPFLDGIPEIELSYERVERNIFFSNELFSGQLNLDSGVVSQWGAHPTHAYTPETMPQVGRNFWLSPVALPDANTPPVDGELLGPPPPGSFICYYNGRMYIAAGRTLWATKLYAYNYVNKTEGYRQFEGEITGLAAVDDGVYVGTVEGLFFLGGVWKEHKRIRRSKDGVLPGTMIAVAGELFDPAARPRPDIPTRSQGGMTCMTTDGLVVGLSGGDTYNLTRNDFAFPDAVAGSSVFRSTGGFNSLVTVLQSEGTPTITGAAFGDRVSATLIRNGQVVAESSSDDTILQALDGTILGRLE